MGVRANLQVKDDELREALAGKRYLVIDGAMGTMLIRGGHEEANNHPELLNIEQPEVVTGIHRAYVEAGADIVTTNTFGANARKLEGAADVADVFAAAVKCARDAGARYVAGDIGPTGGLMAPYGDVEFEDAYGLFAEEVRAGVATGCDLFIVETMTDLLEAKAAVLAVVENSDLPLIAQMTFNENGKTLMGTSPAVAAVTLAQLGADVVGMNCSLGPDQVAGIARELNEASPVPVVVQPNAGLPVTEDGGTRYEVTADEFVADYGAILQAGTRFVGSCCGSDPDFTRGLAGLVAGRRPGEPGGGYGSCATGPRALARLDAAPLAQVAQLVNPEGGDDLRAIKKGLRRCKADIAAVDLSGFAGADGDTLDELADELSGFAKKPLWLQTDDAALLEPLVRPFAGCPVVGTGTGEASAELRDFAQRYGCPLA